MLPLLRLREGVPAAGRRAEPAAGRRAPRPRHHGPQLQPGRRQGRAQPAARPPQDGRHRHGRPQLQPLELPGRGHGRPHPQPRHLGHGEQDLRVPDDLLPLQHGRDSAHQQRGFRGHRQWGER